MYELIPRLNSHLRSLPRKILFVLKIKDFHLFCITLIWRLDSIYWLFKRKSIQIVILHWQLVVLFGTASSRSEDWEFIVLKVLAANVMAQSCSRSATRLSEMRLIHLLACLFESLLWVNIWHQVALSAQKFLTHQSRCSFFALCHCLHLLIYFLWTLSLEVKLTLVLLYLIYQFHFLSVEDSWAICFGWSWLFRLGQIEIALLRSHDDGDRILAGLDACALVDFASLGMALTPRLIRFQTVHLLACEFYYLSSRGAVPLYLYWGTHLRRNQWICRVSLLGCGRNCSMICKVVILVPWTFSRLWKWPKCILFIWFIALRIFVEDEVLDHELALDDFIPILLRMFRRIFRGLWASLKN